jgi:hypothetical protein
MTTENTTIYFDRIYSIFSIYFVNLFRVYLVFARTMLCSVTSGARPSVRFSISSILEIFIPQIFFRYATLGAWKKINFFYRWVRY